MEPPESSSPRPHPEEGEGKEEVKEADELKLGVAKDTATETSDVESPMAAQRQLTEGDGELEVEEHQDGDRMTTESLSEQEGDRENKYYGEGKDKVGESDHEWILNVAEDSGKKQVKEADEVKLDEAKDTSETLGAESSMAAQSRLTEGDEETPRRQGPRHRFAGQSKKLSLTKPSDEATRPRVEWMNYSMPIPNERRPRRKSCSIVISRGESAAMMSSTESLTEQNRVNINSSYIHKVHPGLRSHGEIAKHYEPVLVSIGPYHHGKEALQDMERKKKQYMQVLLERVKEKSSDAYMKALENEGGEPKQARHCYVDTFTMDVNSFRECVVLDGLFMIELLRRKKNFDDYDDKDMFFTMEWMETLLDRDLLLFENQIPLFVLRQLFELTEERHSEMDFVELALGFFDSNGKRISHKEIEKKRLDNIPHLLGLVYEAFVPETHIPCDKTQKPWVPIWSAEALEEVGVTFAKADDGAAISDISFNSGTLRIPRLVITDNTECFFRNLVAYEQYSNRCCLHQITNYLQVMDYLINTPKDVELLRHCGIIENMLGDDVKVSTMFSQICSGVLFNKDEFFYAEMFDEVNKFCMRRRNVWMNKLKNEYFGSPWALISFMAAVVLLLLAATQTVFAVISHYKQ